MGRNEQAFMDDYFLSLRKYTKTFSHLRSWRGRFKGVGTKKRNILIATILAIAASLFFSTLFENDARAQQVMIKASELSNETIDPMNRIGKGLVGVKNTEGNSSCLEITEKKEVSADSGTVKDNDDKVLSEMVQGRPISEMIPYISKRDKKVAAFLVAIAKKESDWGTHSPKVDGRDCHNYWGYKGGYKLTPSGYSCFDSAEQAISIVGDKIESLIEKKIDTPERMLVWKCGSSCAGHDPAGVKSWVATVRMYLQKMDS